VGQYRGNHIFGCGLAHGPGYANHSRATCANDQARKKPEICVNRILRLALPGIGERCGAVDGDG